MVGLTPLALLFTLASIGISETVYLIKKRRTEDVPVCVIGSDCHTVLTSKWNTILGIHNDVLGLMFYIFVCIMSALILTSQDGLQAPLGEAFPVELLKLIDVIVIIVGAAMSIYFTVLQKFVIKAWCFWCLMSAITVFTMTAIVILAGFTI